MPYTAEFDPVSTMRDLLEDNWVPYNECPAPSIVVGNEAEEPYARIDINLGDYIVIRSGGGEIFKGRGNLKYFDKEYPITLDVWTKYNRQRLRDIYREIKAICMANKFSFTGFQLILPVSYTEMVNEQLNIWRAEVQIKVTSAGVCVDTIS
jgi:uncharacterized protein (UPF0128 family)